MSMLNMGSTPSGAMRHSETADTTALLPTLNQVQAALRLQMKPEVVIMPATESTQPSLFDEEENFFSTEDGIKGEIEDGTESEFPGDFEDGASHDDSLESEEQFATPAVSHTSRVFTSVVPEGHPLAISMRQGMFLLVLSALLAGLLPFAWNWFSAVQYDTITPFVPLARFAAEQADTPATDTPATDDRLVALRDTAATLAGLEPNWPVGVAAGLTALGEWINWPMRWLSIWLIYGLAVFVACSFFGTTTTLQHFYAATGYAAVPLLLTGLYFVPGLGTIAVLAGVVWSVMIYVHAVRSVTGLDAFHAAVSVVAPVAILALLSVLGMLGLSAFVYTLLF